MSLASWQPLQTELDRWHNLGHDATFWWRDDDAVAQSQALQKLSQVSQGAFVLLAVIPQAVKPSLADSLITWPHMLVAQHGFAHINHAPRGQGLGAWELGLHREINTVLAEIEQGRSILSAMFLDRFLPVVVPPWNHIADEIVEKLASLGFQGVSAFGHVANIESNSVKQFNCHCDPISWKNGARFTGAQKSVAMLCEHLQARRLGQVPQAQATGFLTHHLDMDAESWAFTQVLNQVIADHPAASWCDPRQLFLNAA